MQKQKKLKTLPNELNIDHQHHLFQSQTDDHYIKTIDLSSPTFATNDLRSLEGDQDRTQRLDQGNKENKDNRVTLSLRDMRDVKDLREIKNKGNVPELRNINQLDGVEMSRKNDMAFWKAQNEKLVQQCKALALTNKQLEQQNRVLNEKLKASKKSLQQKYFAKAAKYLQMPNSSKDESNIDIYLQMQAYRQDYKKCRQNYHTIQAENVQLKQKILQLQQIITNYTEKSEKKKKEKYQNSQKVKEVERGYQEKLEEMRRKVKDVESQGKEKDKIVKKAKEDYQRLKFLKEEIEKKRQEDIKIREELETSLKQKQNLCYNLKQQLIKSQEQTQQLSSKLLSFNKSSESIEQELIKCHQEISQLQLSIVTLQTENSRYKHNIENCKLINEKIGLQLSELRKQNQGFYDQVQSLKIEKDRLESIISKHASSQERQAKKIAELENRYNQTEKQLEEVKIQFEQCIAKNTNRNDPQISKFKQEQEVSEKISSERGEESLKNSLVQEKIKNIEEKYNKIVEQLNKQIEELRKCKESLEMDLDSERERNQKMNVELQNTYRKIEEFGFTDYQGGRDFKQKDRFKRNDFYGTNIGLPFELTRTTKATPQLRMIRQILSAILGTKQPQKLTNKLFRQKQKEMGSSAQYLIDQIKKMAEQMADLFDDRSKQIHTLIQRIEKKEEVISKLLRFTPEQKKICILDYLKVMESDQYTAEHIYKATRNLEEEASQWKRYINSLVEAVEKNEEELIQLRRQLGKYRSEGSVVGARKYDLGYGVGIDKRERIDKIEKCERERDRDRDRFEKYEKYQYRRY